MWQQDAQSSDGVCVLCVRVVADCRAEFCTKCGNKTLSRVTVSYNDDGTVQYFLSRYKTFSTRGLRVSPETVRSSVYLSLCSTDSDFCFVLDRFDFFFLGRFRSA